MADLTTKQIWELGGGKGKALSNLTQEAGFGSGNNLQDIGAYLQNRGLINTGLELRQAGGGYYGRLEVGSQKTGAREKKAMIDKTVMDYLSNQENINKIFGSQNVQEIASRTYGPASGITAKMRAGMTPEQRSRAEAQVEATGQAYNPADTKDYRQQTVTGGTPQPTGVNPAAQKATNLWEFYTSQGKALPSIGERTPLYQQYGGTGTYTGTAEQNTFLLGKLKGGLPTTQPPGSADQAKTTPSVNIPGGAPTTGDTSLALGAAKGLGATTDSQIQQYTQNLQSFDNQKSKLAAWFTDQTKNFESMADTRAALNEKYNIQGKLAEIDALGSDFNKRKAAMEEEVGKTTDALATTGFISRQTAAIQRRYAPELNRLSAEINFKTGLLTKSQDLIDQAVKDATADQKFQLDQAKTFYDMNMDIIDNMEDNYKDAYKEYIRQQEVAYDRAFAEKKLVADLARDNVNAGITLNDTYETALQKFQAAGGNLSTSDKSKNLKAPTAYKIVAGDDLYKVSQKLGIQHAALIAANPYIEPNNLQPGQIINLPSASTIKPVTANELEQHINQQISTPEFKALSSVERAEFIQFLGGNPEDFGY